VGEGGREGGREEFVDEIVDDKLVRVQRERNGRGRRGTTAWRVVRGEEGGCWV
jgi:hypothetical protein